MIGSQQLAETVAPSRVENETPSFRQFDASSPTRLSLAVTFQLKNCAPHINPAVWRSGARFPLAPIHLRRRLEFDIRRNGRGRKPEI